MSTSPPPERADLVVVGAGPAGSAAATRAARAGLTVILLDKATFPRDKCCGDGLTTAALVKLQQMGLDPRRVRSWQAIRQVAVRSPDGTLTELELPEGPGTFVAAAQRSDLDAALVEVARSAGADVRQGCRVSRVRVEPGDVEVATEDERSFVAPFLIAADGAWSTVARQLLPDRQRYLGAWHAVRRYSPAAGAGSPTLWVCFEEDLLPGYAWSFPLAGGVQNVGYGIHRRPGSTTGTMRRQWEELWSRPHLRALLGDEPLEGTPRSWPIPGGIDRAELCAGERVLFVGDAARAADTFTGEGIAQALASGVAAADAVRWAGPVRPWVAARQYRTWVARNLAVDERLGRYLSRALSHRRGAVGAMRLVRSSGPGRRAFARWMFDDPPRAFFMTPTRWKSDLVHLGGLFRSG